MADPFTILGGVVLGGLGAITGASEAKQARDAQDRLLDSQYNYAKKVDQFNWKQTKREYRYRKDEVNTARQNQENNLVYQEQSALRDYRDQLAIRDFEYGQQIRMFNESERIYGMQLGFNNMAAQQAQQAEERRYQEILTGMAFDQQDMLVKMLQEEGQVQASGVSGRSAGKVLASALASYGRNQAIMAESLVSATRDSDINRKQIELDKYGADLAAQARRMLKPMKGPAPSAPLKMPRATILDPLKPKRGPKPIRGVNTLPANTGLSIASNFISAGLDGYKMFGGSFT